MSKNSWLSICLMLGFTVSASAAGNLSEPVQATYQNDRTLDFNYEEDELNDQGFIRDMEESEVIEPPTHRTPIKGKAQDCKQSGGSEDCKEVDIVN